MIIQLNHCPFCGHGSPTCENIDGEPDGAYEVNCGRCQGYTGGETKDNAIAAWQRRFLDGYVTVAFAQRVNYQTAFICLFCGVVSGALMMLWQVSR